MKKILAALLTVIMLFGCLTGCGSSNSGNTKDNTSGTSEGKSMKIVTTIYPEYDWVMAILGDKADNSQVTLLLDNGVDLHSYQPTAEDMVKIRECDMFIYVGGESDGWVEEVIGSSQNDDMVIINLLDVLGDAVKEEEIVEGMEPEHEHEHEEGEEDHEHEEGEDDHEHEEGEDDHEHEEGEEDHEHEEGEDDHEHEEGEEEEEEMDEHVWLSLRNASVICKVIAEKLGTIDTDNKDLYMSNYEAYKSELDNLDKEYQAAVEAGNQKTILFGDRFPFRYLTDDYGLDYYAAFVGCSAESEASFETIVFLAGKVDELGLPAILTIEGPDHKLAETVKDTTESKDQKILTLDSMQSTTSKDMEQGTTYLSIMKNNLEVLKEALQ